MSSAREEFIKKYSKDVIDAARKSLDRGYKIFPSVIMAQMILESANTQGVPGQGITAVKANNFFGIKADSSWKGDKMAFNTPKDGKPVNYFRVYKNVEDSIVDHDIFLEQNNRYHVDNPAKGYANIFDDNSPEEQAKDIAAARYSESSNYANTLITLINAYGLKKLDEELFSEKKS